jgi:predicted acylesterase/phospholipase RssA
LEFLLDRARREHVGIIHSLIVTYRLHGIDPYTFRVDVPQRISEHPANRVAELTPRLWKLRSSCWPQEMIYSAYVAGSTSSETTESVSEVRSGATPVFAIFEGGGAKGIAHVGAYAAADEMSFEFVGVAGASAGAIVASLIAVGFKPNDIFNPSVEGQNIFSAHNLSPLQALGEKDWRHFQRLRQFWLKLWIPIFGLFAATFIARFLSWIITARILGLLTLCLIAAAALRGRALWTARGIFDPAHFTQHFNAILRQRVLAVYQQFGQPDSEVPENIRFRDIDPRVVPGFCRLKIVATDISGQQLRLFDHRTPDVVVAEAVAASIAIPGLFKPAAIPSFCDEAKAALARYYADGGLVSNLPVWCFSEEKAAAERRRPNSLAIPIVAFTLSDASILNPSNVALRSIPYFRQVLQSAIFGGQTVVQEFVPDLYAIQLPTSFGVLAFDATWEQARSAHEEARHKAAADLFQRLIVEPREWQSVLSSACQDIQANIVHHLSFLSAKDLPLRAAVFEPNRPAKPISADAFVTAYKVTRSFNMEKDADDRLTLDAECPGVPEAFEQREAVFWAPGSTGSRVPIMTKYERALVRRSVKCSICVPIFSSVEAWKVPAASRNQPLAVVALDTDEDILSHLKGNQALLELIIEATSGISVLLTEGRRGHR